MTYLYDVGGLVDVLFEDQNGGSVSVDVEAFLQIGCLCEALVHIAKLQMVFISEGCEL